MRFEVIMADPPWSFDNVKTGGSFLSGAAQKYPTMELAAIQNLPVPALASPNAALFLWVPSRLKFSHGATTLAAWGFKYQATVYWNKLRLGMGFWFRGQVEELLVATRGDVAPFGCQLPNIISQRADEHSAKPEEFRRLIETATGKFDRRNCVELFQRRTVPNWTGVGNMVTGRDVREDMTRLARLGPDDLASWAYRPKEQAAV